MRAAPVPRCPWCWTLALREDGSPPIPGMLVVCIGCAAPSRFEGERLVRLDAGDIPEEQRAELLEVQRRVQSMYEGRGMPPGYRWGRGAVCAGCWQEQEPDRAPLVVYSNDCETCELCGSETRDGIYRRMLMKQRNEGNADVG